MGLIFGSTIWNLGSYIFSCDLNGLIYFTLVLLLAVGNCEIESVDVEEARAVEGFVEWVDHNDIPVIVEHLFWFQPTTSGLFDSLFANLRA